MNNDEIERGPTKIIGTPLNLPLEVKKKIISFILPYPEIERVYLVNAINKDNGKEHYGLGLEFCGGPNIQVPYVWRDRLPVMRKNINKIIGIKKLSGIYIVNNIDKFFHPNGIKRFTKLAECIYQKGKQDQNKIQDN